MTKPFSPLLSNAAILAGCGVLAGAAWAGYSALVVLAGLALAAALVTRLWSRLCLKGVTCERSMSERRVFPDEEVLLSLRVVNRKLLPLPWVEVRDEMPARLAGATVTDAEATERPDFVALSRSTPLLWYSAATFTRRLDSSARGYYPLGPLSVTSGDIFGLHPRSHTRPDIDHLIVYPRTYPLAELGIRSLSHIGEVGAETRLFDDPSRLMGVREYVPGDSLRRIHWKASARSRALQLKLFEYTTDHKVAVFLAVDTFGEQSPDDFELGVSTAASVARHFLERDVQTGLFVNTRLADTGHQARIAPGNGNAQLMICLETLAKTTADIGVPFVDFFDHERGALGFGGSLVFVVGEVSEPIELLTADLARSGRRVLGFHVGGGDGDATPGEAAGPSEAAGPGEAAGPSEGAGPGLTSGAHSPGIRWRRVEQPAPPAHDEVAAVA